MLLRSGRKVGCGSEQGTTKESLQGSLVKRQTSPPSIKGVLRLVSEEKRLAAVLIISIYGTLRFLNLITDHIYHKI